MKILFSFFALLVLGFSALGQERIWKAGTGHEIKAEFVEIKDNRVFLKTQDGVISPTIESLAEESRNLATKLNTAAVQARLKALTPAIKASKILPENYVILRNNLVGVYTTDAFDLYLYEPSSFAYIFIKEKGKYLSEPLRLHLEVHYIDTSKIREQDRYVPRPAVSLLEKPTYEKGVFNLRRLHKDDVKSELHIEVINGAILAGYTVDDPPGLSYKSKHILGLSSPAAYVVEVAKDGIEQTFFNPRVSPAGITRTELLQTLSGWTVDFRLRDKPSGMQTSFPYTKATQRLPAADLTSVDISGGVYGPCSVSVTSTGLGGHMYPWIYPGKSPMDGFSIQFSKENPTTPANLAGSMLKIVIKQ